MRRTFVDATGASVPLLRTVRRVVAADDAVAALLLELGATVVGCAGTVEGIESVGPPRTPDPAAIAGCVQMRSSSERSTAFPTSPTHDWSRPSGRSRR